MKGNNSMKIIIAIVLLAFGSSAFISGQDVTKKVQGNDRKQRSAQVTLSPASWDFGNQGVMTTSKPVRVTLANKTDKPIQIRRINMSGKGGEEFIFDYNYDYDECTDIDVTIEPGKSCSVGVVFYPIEPGQRASFLLVSYDDPDNPQKIPLRGNGIETGSVKQLAGVLGR